MVAGVHAQLSNISLDRTWVESEEFEYNGKTVKRLAGAKVGNVLKTFVDLREKNRALVTWLCAGWVLIRNEDMGGC